MKLSNLFVVKAGLVGFLAVGTFSLVFGNDGPKEKETEKKTAMWTRCTEEDQLESGALASGRLAWANKCGFLRQSDFSWMSEAQRYPTFIHENGNFKAPTNENESCSGWKKDYIICNVGCFTPDQKVLFNGRYIPIAEASKSESTVSSLTKGSTFSNLTFEEQDIEAFISGDTEETVFLFSTAKGRQVEVTTNHPLVKGDGTMIKASQAKVGDTLLGIDGASDKIVSITTRTYKGYVYNLQPISTVKIENIHVVNDLLTGSNRFQSEWSELDFRLSLRL